MKKENGNILIIAASSQQQKVFSRNLQGLAHLQFMNSTEEAIEKTPKALPDLIFLKATLPQDFDRLNSLKQHSLLQNIPLALITDAKVKEEHWQQLLDWGVTDMLEEPLSGFKIKALVGQCLKLKAAAQVSLEAEENEFIRYKWLFNKTETIAKLGYWILNFNSNTFIASEGARRIYGITQDIIHMEDVTGMRLPEYNAMMQEAIINLVQHQVPYDVTFKIKRKSDGAILVLHSKADYDAENNSVFGIVTDITQEYQYQQELSLMERRWKDVIESSPVPMAINDKDMNITFINSAFTHVFGYTREDIPTVEDWFLKAYPDETYRENTRIHWLQELEKYHSRGLALPALEFEVTCKNGSRRAVEISSSWLGNTEEKNQLVVLYDVTERKQAKEKELEYYQVLESAVNSISMRVFWKDKNLQYLGCNENFAKDAGRNNVKEIIGKNDYELSWRDQAQLYQTDDLAVINSGKPKKNIEEPQTTPDGNTIILLTNKIPLLGTDGEIRGVIGTYMDITRSKNAELALRESNKRYNLISKATHDDIWDLDLVSGKIIRAEDPDQLYVNYPFFTEQDWVNLVHPDDLSEFLKSKQKVIEDKEALFWEHEYRMLNKQGAFIYVNSKGIVVRDEEGRAIRFIGATQDISERIKHLQAIEEQNKKLHEIAWIQSHIVRAPLARIMGLIELIKMEENAAPELNELLGHILKSALEFDEIIKQISKKSQTI